MKVNTISSGSQLWDVLIVGAGAAGMMCALHCARASKNVLLLEHNDSVGKKIRISGGGRCNFTNLDVRPENFLSSNPHFCRSALARYSAKDFISWIESEKISYHEKTLGQLFCDHSAQEIVDLFTRSMREAGVDLRTRHSLKSLKTVELQHGVDNVSALTPKGSAFIVETGQPSNEFRSKAVVVATGGLSIPKIGASDVGLRIAKQFGMRIVEPRPALVPLLIAPSHKQLCARLSGVSCEVIVHCERAEFREMMLFTHRGLSGPAILQISSYLEPGEAVRVNLLPHHNALDILEEHSRSAMELKTLLAHYLPKRLAEEWCEQGPGSKPIKQYQHKERTSIAEALHSWSLPIAGTEGFEKAEVTRGGVNTDDLSSKTMESSTQKGLYFIGEVVDVTGWLGGYNFQWAWSSAVAAAQAICAR